MDMIINCILNDDSIVVDTHVDILHPKLSYIYKGDIYVQHCINIYQDCFCDESFHTVNHKTKIVWLK